MKAALLLLLASILGTSAAAQTRWYVDDSATGANTGASWADAYVDLQSALAAATSAGIGEIWVAEGTYKPSATGDRTASFRPAGTLWIYGGFAGTESFLYERAGFFDRTVLSGDLAGDDAPGFANRADNSEHVVDPVAPSFGVFDGFTIRGGSAARSDGGGWYSTNGLSQVIVRHCRFEDNEARRLGGAVFTDWGVADWFVDCSFVGNRASEGGAAHHEWYGAKSDLGFVRCRFLGNVATGVGGGALAGSSLYMENCIFSGNAADGTSSGGGAILGHGYLRSCTVVFNHAAGGPLVGGIRGSISLLSSIIWGNFDQRGTVLRSQVDVPASLWNYAEGCCVQGWGPGIGGERMLSADPEFRDPLGPDGAAGTPDDDLELGPLSPCVDALPRDPYVYVDLEGRTRNLETRACAGEILDIGALERQAAAESPTFCPATPSSLGTPASLSTPCLLEIGGGPVEVVVSPVPNGFGILLLGDARTEVPFGNGFLCVAGTVRSSTAVPSVASLLQFHLDPGDVLVGGTSWNLQAIYRDRRAGGAGMNASEAIAITVLP